MISIDSVRVRWFETTVKEVYIRLETFKQIFQFSFQNVEEYEKKSKFLGEGGNSTYFILIFYQAET